MWRTFAPPCKCRKFRDNHAGGKWRSSDGQPGDEQPGFTRYDSTTATAARAATVSFTCPLPAASAFHDYAGRKWAHTYATAGDTVSGTARQRSGWSHLCSANVYQTASHYSSLPRNKWITECTDRFHTSLYRGQLLSQRKWKTDSYQTALWL